MDKVLFHISDNKYILAVLVLRSKNVAVVSATGNGSSANWTKSWKKEREREHNPNRFKLLRGNLTRESQIYFDANNLSRRRLI